MNNENNLNNDYEDCVNPFEFNQVNNQILFHKFIMINEILDKRNKKQNTIRNCLMSTRMLLLLLLSHFSHVRLCATP